MIPLRRIISLLLLSSLCAFTGFAADTQKPIRLLTIGNSFAGNATEYLSDFAEAAGVHIDVHPANIGGGSLERHVRHLDAWERDPNDAEARPYRDRSVPDAPPFSLVEALQSGPWDFITIQQVSIQSFKEESFEPYAGRLIATIREHAPEAEILIHQTWAYRKDSPLFASGDFSQEQMYEGLRSAYDRLAERYGLRIIQVGDAFQLARQRPPWYFPSPDPNFDYENPPPGQLPEQSGSLNAGWYWKTDPGTGVSELRLDANHASTAGKYLGSAVFFATLTGKDPREIDWLPSGLDAYRANSLKQAAHQAVVNRKPEAGFVSIFDGKSLDGWEGDPRYWRVEKGVLIGEVTAENLLQRNSFLIWRGGEPENFELKAEYRVSLHGNSGLSYRNRQLDDAPWSLAGYQADIDGPSHDPRLPRQRYVGQLWEERGRGFLARRGELVQIDAAGDPRVIASVGDAASLEDWIDPDGWNHYHVIAQDNVLMHLVNGRLMSLTIDDDPEGRRSKGLIGVQVHTGPPQTIEYRNIRLKIR